MMILKRQEQLKKELYSRFGDSINLENWYPLTPSTVQYLKIVLIVSVVVRIFWFYNWFFIVNNKL